MVSALEFLAKHTFGKGVAIATFGIGYVIAGSATASILIALLDKALTDGARNGAARVAWALAAIALGTYVVGAVGGVSYVIERGNVDLQFGNLESGKRWSLLCAVNDNLM